MEEHVKEELSQQFLLMFQKGHTRPHPPVPSEKMRGAPMILHYIKTHDGAVSPSEISRQMGTSTARITAVLGNLEKKGLIVRSMDESDRRKIRITLTEKGQQHVQKMEQDIVAAVQNLVEYLGEEDARSAIHLMERLQGWQPEGLCGPETDCGYNNLGDRQ